MPSAPPPGDQKPVALKDTLSLPRTDFPMKANLPQSEPARLTAWRESGLYEQIRDTRRGSQRWILHDGPPYANGPLHLGHALNKCLKDFIVKCKTMAGFDSPYVPGFDCHGLPIEIKVDEQLGRKKLDMPAGEFLRHCREYAQKYVDLQTSQFVRLGVFGRWDDPYLTMSRPYEARILETFYRFLEAGFVYRGLRPVYWCIHDRTALADAEIEYEQHSSPSVYVRYDLTSDPGAIHPGLAGKKVATIIWTTTPWTLPASLAVAFHPEFDYVALEQGGQVYIVAEALAASVREACKLESAVPLATFKGDRMERAAFRHPFLDRSILGVLADYVTADQGTGAVHTAPAHGADDFRTGARYGLDQTCHVDNAGRLRDGLPEYDGQTVFQANQPIIDLVASRGALLGRADIFHSYPHCWRCHNPVIFRATEQWFINIDHPMEIGGQPTTFRKRALDEIKNSVKWDPAWGEERIANMIATRPDWCISRQRVWGVPIAVFLCGSCNQPLMDSGLNQRILSLFEREGAGVWHTAAADALLPQDAHCANCGGTDFRRETDILDVWFDSGASWHAVLETEPGLAPPADLYFEGGDQYRGWFHTSLLTSVGVGQKHESPFRMVGTAGWTLDEQGRAMSKSLGNGVDPVDIADRLGAEIVRLWVASVDFREDVVSSENIMLRLAENYRKLRNTFRFLLGNLAGFDPASDAVSDAQLVPLDRYMLTRSRELVEKVSGADGKGGWYGDFQFHRVYHAINDFCIVDLSAFYLDLLKDRLYTFAPKGIERRSAQTVLWRIAEALVRLVAPILTFTSDEVWQYLPAVSDRPTSVHLAMLPKADDLGMADPELVEDWDYLLKMREWVLKKIEEMRQEKKIGKGLEAKVCLQFVGTSGNLSGIKKYEQSLKELFNVSQVSQVLEVSLDNVRVERVSPDQFKVYEGPEEGLDLYIDVVAAEGHKCDRCWNYYADDSPLHVRQFGAWANVCGRCADALRQMGHTEGGQ
ncbi:MAG TPA: isoleucine--tRNA ligase [Acidobacteriaceae bacterium]|jgi:isoleucyl-tRNA synthetase|nr:isoleucine--tRNA ligase [Acidobacteriaceae bacterium]